MLPRGEIALPVGDAALPSLVSATGVSPARSTQAPTARNVPLLFLSHEPLVSLSACPQPGSSSGCLYFHLRAQSTPSISRRSCWGWPGELLPVAVPVPQQRYLRKISSGNHWLTPKSLLGGFAFLLNFCRASSKVKC